MTMTSFQVDELNDLFVHFRGERGGAVRWLDEVSAVASSSDAGVATASIEHGQIKVSPVAPGTCTVSVEVDAAPGDRVKIVRGEFNVTVTPAEAESLVFEEAYQQMRTPTVGEPVAEPSPSPAAEPVADTVTQ